MSIWNWKIEEQFPIKFIALKQLTIWYNHDTDDTI